MPSLEFRIPYCSSPEPSPIHTDKMNDVIRRIDVDSEGVWQKVQDNVQGGITSAMEARLAALPGGRDGPAARALRAEVEMRLRKVSPAWGEQ